MPPEERTSSHTILRNSFWSGLETIIEFIVFISSSIVVARYLEPTKLGEFAYINFFVSILTRATGSGVSSATGKYMMEFLGAGRPGVARSVYRLAWRYQLISSVSIAALGSAAVIWRGDPGTRIMGVILLVSIVPGLMSWVPAQANTAFEDFRPNTTSALGYLFSYAAVIAATVYFRWDLIGVASATLVGRIVEVVVRTIAVHRRLRALPLEPLEPGLIHRIRRYSVQGIGLQLLTTVVWDRSEVVFLHHYSPAEQVGFYSVSFTFTSNMLTAARVLAGSAGVTLMAEISRNVERAREIGRTTARFLLLATLPVSIGAAAITLPVIRLIYGTRYLPAVPVMIVAVLLGIPRAPQAIPETTLRALDRQQTIIFWYTITGVVNLLLDWLLIPRYGAMGAAWGNGLGQLFGVVVIWIAGSRVLPINFPTGACLRIGAASGLMGVCAYLISHYVPGVGGVILAVLTGVVVFPLLLRLFRALEPADRDRLAHLADRTPQSLRAAAYAVVRFVTPQSA